MDRNIGSIKRISLNITIGGLLALIIVIFTLSYHFFPSLRPEITFFSAGIGIAAALYGSYYRAQTLRVQIIRDKQHRSYEMLSEFNMIDKTRIRVFIEKELGNNDLSSSEIYHKVKSEPGNLSDITVILGMLEDIAIGVQDNFLDEKPLYTALCFIVPYTFDKLFPYIVEERKLHNDDRLYCELEKLVYTWKTQKLLSNEKNTTVFKCN